MSNKTSNIFSLADPFEYKKCDLNTFIELGNAPLGVYHIAIFNKNVVNSILHIDYKNAVALNKFCSVYNLVNKRGSIYGTLFAVNYAKTIISSKKLIVNSVESPIYDFNIYPYANERSNLLFFRDGAETILVISSVPEENPFIVLDDRHG